MIYDPSRKEYLAPIPYLISHYIYEYDISKANLNILYYKGIISKEEYDIILSFPRGQRQIYFGNLQKDPDKAKALSDGLTEIRAKFLADNNVTDQELLSVKNDAIFLIDKVPAITKYGNIEFIRKNVYTSFYCINNLRNKLEIYYGLDKINDKEYIDVKGINDSLLSLHTDYFIQFLCSVFESIECGLIQDSLDIINTFHKKYINRELDLGYYREFNADSCFRVSLNNGLHYLLTTINPSQLPYLNITTNLNIIRELFAIVSGIYYTR